MTDSLSKALGDLLPETSQESFGFDQNEPAPLSVGEQYRALSALGRNEEADALANQVRTEARQRYVRDQPRPLGTVVTDTANAAIRGTSSMAASIATLSEFAEPTNIIGNALQQAGERFESPTLEGLGIALQLPTAEAVAEIVETDQAIQNYVSSGLSENTQLQIDDVQRQTQEAKIKNAENYGNAFERELANLWDTSKAYIDNPLASADLGFQQVPQLLAGVAVGKLATVATKAELTAASLLQGEQRLAAMVAANKARNTLAGRLQLASITGQEAGGAANSTAKRILETSFEDLEKFSPAYREYIAQGLPPERARELVALSGGQLAGIIQAPLAFLTGSVAARFETQPFTVSGSGIGEKLIDAAKNIGRELAEEIPQSTTGQLAQNIAVSQTSDETQEITEDLGQAAAEGAVGAIVSTATTQAPSVAVTAAKDIVPVAGKAAYTIGKTGIRIPAAIISGIAGRRRTNSTDSQNIQEDETNASTQFEQTANQVDEVFETPRTTQTTTSTGEPTTADNNDVSDTAISGRDSETTAENLATENQVEVNIFSDAGRNAVQNISGTESSNARKLVDAVRAVEALPEDATEERRALGIYAADLYGELQNEFTAIEEQLNTGSGNTEQLTQQANVIRTLLQNERSVNLVSQIDEMRVSDEEWDNVVNNLPEVTAENLNSEEVQKALLTIKNKSVDTPADVTPEQYDYVLNHDTSLTPEQRSTLETKREVARAVMDSNDVRNNIRRQSRAGFKSINEYANEVFQAVRNNLPEEASESLTQLRRFAETAQGRAAAHDEVAQRLFSTKGIHTDEMTQVEGYYQLDSEGNIDKTKPQFVNILAKNGLRNLLYVQQDADAVTAAFNALATKYPELGASPVEPHQQSEVVRNAIAKAGLTNQIQETVTEDTNEETDVITEKTIEEGESIGSTFENDYIGTTLHDRLLAEDALMREQSQSDGEILLEEPLQLAEALDIISEENQDSPFIQFITAWLGSKLSDYPVSVVLMDDSVKDKPNGIGYYSELEDGTNTIYLDRNEGMTLEILLHEAVHAATSRYLLEHDADDLYVRELQELLDFVRNSGVVPKGSQAEYGLSNLQEFVAVGLTNPELQTILKQTPYKESTLFGSFVDIIRNLLGITTRYTSAFEALLDISDNISNLQTGERNVRNRQRLTTEGTKNDQDTIQSLPEESEPETIAEPETSTQEEDETETEGTGDTTTESREDTPQARTGGITEAFAELTPQTEAFNTATNADERAARQNQLLASFNISGDTTNLTVDFLADLQEVYEDFPEELEAVIDPNADFTKEQRAGIGSYIAELKDVMSLMNQRLAAYAKSKKVIESFTKNGGDRPAWAFSNGKALYATVIDGDEITYQNDILTALSMAGFNWLLGNDRDLSGMSDKQIADMIGVSEHELTPDLRNEIVAAGVPITGVINQIATSLEQYAGLTPKRDASRSYGRTITKALSQELLAALREAGVITITPFPIANSNLVSNFVKVNTNRTSALTEALRNQVDIADKLLLKKREPKVNIGTKIESVAQNVNGKTLQKVPTKAKQAIKVLQDTAYYLNTLYVAMLDALDDANNSRYAASGYNNKNSLPKNKAHAASLDGKNIGIESGSKALSEHLQNLQEYAEVNGLDISEVPTYFKFGMDSNGRLRMTSSHNPQSNKYWREAITAARTTVDLNNEQQVRELFLHLAQGLGIKVDKKNNDAAIEETRIRLGLDGISEDVTPEQEAIAVMINGISDGFDTWTDEDRQTVANAVRGKGEKYQHTLLQAAKYLLAKESGETTIDHFLTFEVDGVTDGPANSIIHMVMNQVSKSVLTTLKKVGWLINRPDETSNQIYGEADDLYTSVAKKTTELANLIKANGSEPDVRAIRQAVRLMHYAGLTEMDSEAKEVFLNRAFAKAGVTPAVYGAGAASISATMVGEYTKAFYKHMSDVLAGATLNQGFVNALRSQIADANTLNQLHLIEQGNEQAIINFEVPSSVLSQMAEEFQKTLGDLVYEAIDIETHGSLTKNRELASLAQIQSIFYRDAYKKAYEELRQQKIESGELASNEMLSSADEADILTSLQNIAPIYSNNITGTTKATGMYMAEVNRNGIGDGSKEQTSLVKKARSSALDGTLESNATLTEIELPGVRMVPLLVISSGDASMMANYFTQNTNLTAQNVYDGLDTVLGNMVASSNAINDAVRQGWSEDVLLKAVQAFSDAKRQFPSLDSLSNEAITDLAQTLLKWKERQLPIAKQKVLIQQRMDEREKAIALHAKRNKSVRMALLEVKSNISHMGGVDTPYVTGTTELVGSEEDIAKAIQQRANEIYAGFGTTRQEHDERLLQMISERGESVNGNQILSAENLRGILLNHGFGGDKYRQFLARSITRAIPNSAKVVFGSLETINELQAKLFPDVEPMQDAQFGRQIGDYIFLAQGSPETLLHESVHMVIAKHVNDYFKKGVTQTEERANAIRALNRIMDDFVSIPVEHSSLEDIANLQLMRAQVANALRQGDRATALNEFIAWVLSNKGLNDIAARNENTNQETRVEDSVFQKLFKGVRRWLAKILGVPMRKDFQSYLESLTGHFDAAIYQRPTNDSENGNNNSISEVSEYLSHDNSAENSNVLTETMKVLDENFAKPVLNPAERPNYSVNAEVGFNGKYNNILAATDWFQAQGFQMNEQERHAFQMLQSYFHSGAQLNTNALNQLSKLFEYLVPNISVEDFMVNPNSTEQVDIDAAQRMYDALINPSEFKEHQLANFAALAISNGHLQRVLRRKQLPKAQWLKGNSIDARLNHFSNQLIQNLAEVFINGSRKNDVNGQINLLSQKIATINDSSKSSIIHKLEAPLRKADAAVASRISRLGQAATEKLAQRLDAGQTESNLDIAKNFGLAIAGLGDRQGQAIEAIQTMVNSGRLWRPITQLFNEMVGTTETNSRIMTLLQQAKNQVSAVRQEVKREVPKVLAKQFTRKLATHEQIALRKILGESDLQVLGSDFSLDDLRDILSNQGRLYTEISAYRQDIQSLPNGERYLAHAEALAEYMVTKDTHSPHLLRNAYAIASLAGLGVQVSNPEIYTETISQYVTLLAINKMSNSDKQTVATLLNDERKGVEFMFTYLRGLAKAERNKQSRYNRYNSYKGYIPESYSGSRKLVVVDRTRGKELVEKYGYTYLGTGNYAETSGLGYYFTSQNLTSTYTQGAIQNVEPLIAGVDPISGRSRDLKGSYIITNQSAITSRQNISKRYVKNGNHNLANTQLMPVFDTDGRITAYESPIPEAYRQQHLAPDNDFYGQIATWHSRATEEQLAHTFNANVAKALADMWTNARPLDKGSFVNLLEAAKTSEVDKRTWNSLPAAVKTQLRTAFGDEPIMIRRDVLDNALGYSNFNIGSVFTGETDLPKPVQKGIRDLAVALLGKNAPRTLLAIERGNQDIVSLTKDWIVVRSVVVGYRNILSNFAQLKMHNVGYGDIFKGQLAKLKEVDDFMRNRKEIIDLQLENQGRPSEANLRKIRRLTEANERMSIAPLIRNGELPTVAEGMTIEDDEAIRHGLGGYIDKAFAALPTGLSKAVQYATISKNTPINSALNRMLTYSDLVAKAVLFDKLTLQDGYTTEAALQFIQDEFVNYDNNPGRTRSYLESMGLTWFTNYKLKIQKTNLRLLRDHPLSLLTVQGSAGAIGMDTPLDANMITGDNQHVFGTPLKALEIPSLHPVVQLLN